MAKVSRESLGEMLAEHKAQFAALKARGEVTPPVAALCEALFSTLQLLLILLEIKTKKTAAASRLTSTLFPFEKTAPAKADVKSKVSKPGCSDSATARLEIVEHRLKVDECDR